MISKEQEEYYFLSRINCRGIKELVLIAPKEINTMMDMSFMAIWTVINDKLVRKFHFKDNYEAMSFVNAISWMSQSQKHHGEITIGYNDVTLRYWTHELGGITENDFMCAVKTNNIFYNNVV